MKWVNKIYFGSIIWMLWTWGSNVQAQDFTIANTLQDNMVVQQAKPLKVWGKATSGVELYVKVGWYKESYKAIAGKDSIWEVFIPVPKISPNDFTEYQMVVSTSTKKKSINNILLGDVYLCSGQSNMDMQLKPFLPWLLGTMHYQQEIQNAIYPQIRLFDVPTYYSKQPLLDCGGNWTICSPTTVGDFSAVAYFFARDIFLQKRIPIGIVTSSLGATSCQAWTSKETLANDEVLNTKYWYPYETSKVAKEVLDSMVTFEKNLRPTLLYNAMIYPLRHLQLSGILWYQGESNRYDSTTYTRLCSAMIYNWRLLFQQQLPFYYVQVAPYNWQQNDTTAYDYALFREAQAAITKKVPGTAMVVTTDIGDPNDIHPRNKQDVGYRLALAALANIYQDSSIIYRGPEWRTVTTVDSIIKVQFDPQSIGSGLATNDGLPPKHFYIAGADGKFYPASATIVNDEVWLQSPQVPIPVAVRYAFTNYPITNFCNKEGLPAIPFRSSF